jgi:hypothetical protein
MPTRLVLSALVFAVAVANAQAPSTPPGFTSKDVTMPSEQPTAGGPPSSSDPRVCLAFEDRAQIIACAEKYRPRRHVAKG